jgi:hypothetical protein
MNQLEQDRKRFIESVEAGGHFVTLEDGFFYYWADGKGGISPHQLRWLADELDRRNKPLQESLDRYFKEEEEKSWISLSVTLGQKLTDKVKWRRKDLSTPWVFATNECTVEAGATKISYGV